MPKTWNLGEAPQAKITLRVLQLIEEVTKDIRKTSTELQASCASVKVRVHSSTIRKQLVKNVPSWQSYNTKTTAEQKGHLSFTRKHLDEKYGKYSVD